MYLLEALGCYHLQVKYQQQGRDMGDMEGEIRRVDAGITNFRCSLELTTDTWVVIFPTCRGH